MAVEKLLGVLVFEVTIDSNASKDTFYIIRNTLHVAVVDVRAYVQQQYGALFMFRETDYTKEIDTVPLLQIFDADKGYYRYSAQDPHEDLSKDPYLRYLAVDVSLINPHLRDI